MNGEMEQLLVRLAEREQSRFYGKYRGIVRDIDDPDNLCRIKAEVPAVYEDQQSPWAVPALPFAGDSHGLVLLPEVGDGVWIEFEAGDLDRPIWSGCWFASGERPNPADTRKRVLATTAGHKIVLDEDGNEVQIQHPGGAEFTMSDTEIILRLGLCELKITSSEINLNHGMVKVTVAGASLVNDAFKVGV
jgi:Type VI secretion system/phage-baseplate injector OB domain